MGIQEFVVSNISRIFLPWVLGILYFYRYFFFSFFDTVIGDRGDGRFVALVTNHWFRVIFEGVPWKDLNIFYPTQESIGFSDLNLLLAIPNTFMRFAGLDIFLAFTISTIIFNFIGYFSFYLLLTLVFKVNKSIAIFSAMIFTFSSSNVIALSSHPQLFTIYLIPLLLLALAFIYTKDVSNYKIIIFTYLLFGLIFSSSVYIFIFLIISLLFTVFFIFLLYKHLVLLKKSKFFDVKHLMLAIISIVTGMLPGLVVYLPTKNKFGGRNFSEVAEYIPNIINTINVGDQNIVWSYLLNKLDFNIDIYSDELSLNPTPIFLVATLIFSALIYQKHKIQYIFLFTSILNIILISKFNNITPWKLFYAIDGFDSIRALGRLNLVTNLWLSIAFAISLNVILKKNMLPKLLIFFLCNFIFLEQIQTSQNFSISRNDQKFIIKTAQAVPSKCQVFYINSELTSTPQAFIQNDAFLISQISGIPTLNGYSGVYPKNWNLNSIGDPSYLMRINEYVKTQQITRNTCELNISMSKWYLRTIHN